MKTFRQSRIVYTKRHAKKLKKRRNYVEASIFFWTRLHRKVGKSKMIKEIARVFTSWLVLCEVNS